MQHPRPVLKSRILSFQLKPRAQNDDLTFHAHALSGRYFARFLLHVLQFGPPAVKLLHQVVHQPLSISNIPLRSYRSSFLRVNELGMRFFLLAELVLVATDAPTKAARCVVASSVTWFIVA